MPRVSLDEPAISWSGAEMTEPPTGLPEETPAEEEPDLAVAMNARGGPGIELGTVGPGLNIRGTFFHSFSPPEETFVLENLRLVRASG